jgi:DNA-binding NarL/FixJ family response regulator
MTVKVVLADDQKIVRDGLALVLRQLPGIELVAVAQNGEEAVALAAEHRPDVMLMDLRMPGVDGVEATRRIRAALPEVQVVVLTTYADDESVFAALRAGARGYLTKDAGAEEMAHAIERVHAGETLLDPSVQARLLDGLGRVVEPAPRQPGKPPDGLTAREAEILTLIADGQSNADIARRLFISEATVKTHINHAFAKTGVRDRAQAVAYAYRTGLARP